MKDLTRNSWPQRLGMTAILLALGAVGMGVPTLVVWLISLRWPQIYP